MLRSPDVLGLIERTKFIERPEYTQAYYAPNAVREFASSAKVTLRDGRTASHMLHVPHGHPKNPMTDAEIEAKFRSMAQPYLMDPSAVLEALWGLDSAPQASEIVPLIQLDLP
jgi:2-methylcitrate dehydratase